MKTKKFNQVRLLTRQFATHEENVAFASQSRCVCALLARFAQARGASLPGASGVVGDFRDPPATPGVAAGEDGVAVVTEIDDIRGVMSLPDSERKRAFLHLALRTLDVFFAGATPRPWLDAAADVRSADFVNDWTWEPGTLRSPDRRWRTAVTVLHDLREFQVRLEVVDTRALPVFEQVLVRGDEPDERAIAEHLGELRWDEPRRIVLRSGPARNAEWVADLPPSFGLPERPRSGTKLPT